MQQPGAGNEIQLSDAISVRATEGKVDGIILEGQRFDCGDVKGLPKLF